MANQILDILSTQIRFYVSGSFSPVDPATDWTIGSPTGVVLAISGVANGAGRQSDKADLGATRAAAYELLGCVDFTGETPTVGGTIDYYWAPSTHATAANGNVAGNSGVDGAAPDGALGSITLAEFLKQCIYIGSLIVHDGGVVQNGFVGILYPTTRYGQLIVVNNSGDVFETDDVEAHQVLAGIIPEIQ